MIQRCLIRPFINPFWQIISKTYFTDEEAKLNPIEVIKDNSTDVVRTFEYWDGRLKEAGVINREYNLKRLLAHVLKKKWESKFNIETIKLSVKESNEFEKLCEFRCKRMPLQHILGESEFMGLKLMTAPTVFIPRPETEEFVLRILEVYRNYSQFIDMLDVGCGNGAMSLAILRNLAWSKSIGFDCCTTATDLAKKNAELLELQNRFSIYTHTMKENNYVPDELKDYKFNLIISNPPYACTADFALLSPEVLLYENRTAIDGGPDGLSVARIVLKLACAHLINNGKLWLELGADQIPLIKTILQIHYENQLRFIDCYEDQYKQERFVEIEKI